ncbi:3-deoxy-D-manno-octulosonic acid transferase [Psychroserpens sp. BH13MA-6]
MYNLGIHLLSFFLKLIAPFNRKIKLGVDGRRKTFKTLKEKLNDSDRCLWFHCASLGEYEQGLPVFEVLKKIYPEHTIVLTFFSPSGYEIRKNTNVADIVVYLPLDTKRNAKKFLELVRPEFTIFVKYDIWAHFLIELKNQNRRAILISALFRHNQIYFKFYGKKQRKALFSFEHMFVQNRNSKDLLSDINYKHVTVAGDTRFDRVYDQLAQNNSLDFISEFKGNSICVVIGSSWPEDENILIPYINKHASEQLKFIIAPHEITSQHINHIRDSLDGKYVLYSDQKSQTLSSASVFIVDTIGLLSKIYSYADIAYVGGAMGKTGLHNILEPAVFGVPIIIGQNYEKFPEASTMIANAGVVSVSNQSELASQLNQFISSSTDRKTFGLKNFNFIKENKGAVVQITKYIRI